MLNWLTLIKYNLCYCTSDSVWKILLTRIRKGHQVILSFNTSLYQKVRYRCIIYISIIFQAQSIIFPNIPQYMYKPLNMYFTRVC